MEILSSSVSGAGVVFEMIPKDPAKEIHQTEFSNDLWDSALPLF